MNFTKIRVRFIGFWILCFVLAGSVYHVRNNILKYALERSLNHSLKGIFFNTLRIETLTLDSYFQIHAQKITGTIQMPDRIIPLEIAKMDSEGSALGTLTGAPLLMKVRGIKIAETQEEGFNAYMLIEEFPKSSVDLRVIVKGIRIEDLLGLDPVHLEGFTGLIKGKCRLKAGPDQVPVLDLNLEVAQPGGKMPERTLEILKPYIPPQVWNTRQQSPDKKEGVSYKHAAIRGFMPAADRIKVLVNLHIQDYNLNVNLNFEIRIDEKNGFFELFRDIKTLQGKKSS